MRNWMVLVFFSLLIGVATASTNISVSLSHEGNMILVNNTNELNLTITNNNSEYGDEIETIEIGTSAFAISSSTDDDTEGDWSLSPNTFSGNTIIPGESVVFTLNLSSVGNSGLYEVNLTATDNSSDNITETLHALVVEAGDIGIELDDTINSAYILAKNNSQMNTSFTSYPDTISGGDELVASQVISDGFILFNHSTLNEKNATGEVYVNISTQKGKIKYSFTYNNGSYHELVVVPTKLHTYYNNTYESETSNYSSRADAHHVVYVYVNGSAGSLTGKIYNATNSTENTTVSFSGLYGNGNISAFNENSTQMRLEVSNGTYTFFKYLNINRTEPAQVTGLNAYGFSNNGTMFLNWSATAGASYYLVYRNGSYLARSYQNNYTDYNANLNTTYLYNVSAVNSLGNIGNFSSNATNTTSAVDNEPPAAVDDLSAIRMPNATILLNWSQPAGEGIDSYIIWRNASGSYINIANLSSQTNYTDTSLPSGINQSYYYKVEVNDTSNNRINSSSVYNKSDSEAPEFNTNTITLVNDIDSDNWAEIGDSIEINLTELFDRLSSSDSAEQKVDRIYANLSLLGGAEEYNLSNVTTTGWDYSSTFDIKSGNVNGSVTIPLTAIDLAGNQASANVTLSNVYNYKSVITGIEIRNHSSASKAAGNLDSDTWYDLFVSFNMSQYRGDAYLITEVNDTSGMKYFGYHFIPSAEREQEFEYCQGFKTGSNDVTINVFLWNDWATSSSYYSLSETHNITRTVS